MELYIVLGLDIELGSWGRAVDNIVHRWALGLLVSSIWDSQGARSCMVYWSLASFH